MAATAPLVLRIDDADDIGGHEFAPLESAGKLLRDAIQRAGDVPPRLWLSLFVASLRAAREAVETHARESAASDRFAPLVERQPGLTAAVTQHLGEHEDIVQRLNETIRAARSCTAEEPAALDRLRSSAVLIASRLTAHQNRARGLLAGAT